MRPETGRTTNFSSSGNYRYAFVEELVIGQVLASCGTGDDFHGYVASCYLHNPSSACS